MAFALVTPLGVMRETEVESVVLPSALGEMEILPGHRPLLALLVPGELRLRQGEQGESLVIDRGFVYVSRDRVVVTVEQAMRLQEVDVSAVELAQRRAEEALRAAAGQREALDSEEIKRLEAKIRYQLAQKAVKNRYS
ncbi:MAG: ATP synthase F1 subunit epsilon [Puniceicoccales bacterium]|jgi:F-type H+-transporting ATPase subunit epsilon|nr:ATP synthase F1 subunit epsilon [Puniceicoccales bacterium]